MKLYDRSSEQISKGLKLMDKLLAKDVGKGKIQEGDARQARERVSVVDQAAGVRALRDVDMVIEVRRPTPFVFLSSLSMLSRPSRRTSNSNNSYSQNWQLRRGRTPYWPRIRPLSLLPKLLPLLYRRANLRHQPWARVARGVLLVSCTPVEPVSGYNCGWSGLHFFNPVPVMVSQLFSDKTVSESKREETG